MILVSFGAPVHADSPDSQLFIEGFNAYQKSEYTVAADKMNQVLGKYPDTPLRDMALFWISRSHYHLGNNREAARYFSQFMQEYPESPLMGTVEEELPILAQKFLRGETIENTPKSVKVSTPKGDTITSRPASPAPSPQTPPQAAPPPTLPSPAPPAVAVSVSPEDRATRLEAEARRLAEEKKELERIAAEKSRSEQLAMEKLEAARRLEATLSEKLEAEKRERERLQAEKAQLEQSMAARIAEAKSEAEKLARLSSTQQEQAREELSSRIRLLESTLAAEKSSREELEQQKLKLENETSAQLAAARKELEQARQEAELARVAAEKALQDARQKDDLQSKQAIAAIETELTQIRRELETERRQKEELAARLKRETEERERLETEKKALQQVAAASRTIKQPPSPTEAPATGKRRQPRKRDTASLREKAIAEYKRIIDTYPGSAAAASAAAKLTELGISYGPSSQPPAAPVPTMTTTARVLAFEVGQYAGIELLGGDTPVTLPVNSPVTIPFEVVNTGNGPDTFDLSAVAKREISVTFKGDTASPEPLTATPPLAPGERFKGLLTVTLPPRGIDGERFTLPIKASSRFTSDVTRTKELRLIASAPLLRSVIKPDRTTLSPGQTVTYSLSLLNVGSAAATAVRFTLVHPPLLTPVLSEGFRPGEGNSLVMDDLTLKSGENREIKVSFTLSPTAIAGQELFVQGVFHNTRLDRRDSFMASAVTVETIRVVKSAVRTPSVTALPGQTVVIPLTVTNEGNTREDFSIATMIPAATPYTIYLDQNRDGLKQKGEPVINHVGPLAPFETANILLELQTPKGSGDSSTFPLSVRFVSDADPRTSHSVDIQLTMVRPVVDLAVNGKGGKLRPGEVATLELIALNSGSGIARSVEIDSIIPPQMEVVASDPPASPGDGGRFRWVYAELGSGEKRTISLTYRVKAGTALGTSIQLQNLLSYQDSLGNRY
ncbi:MAG: hypothetical protein Fur0034_17320 [Desulfuromonadia bacterium]